MTVPRWLRPDLAALHAYEAHDPGECDKLDANEVPYGLPDWFQDKLAWAVQHTLASHRYPSAQPERLRQLLGEYTGLAPDWITLGNGSDELIRSLIMIRCLGQGKAVASPEPTFAMYRILALTLGVPFIAVPRDPETFGLDHQAIEREVDTIGLLFLTHPNSPTGNGLTAADLDFVRKLPEHILVVFDEAYFEFSGQTVVQELTHRPWVVLRTLSKAFRQAAQRVGYALAQPTIIQTLEKVRLPYNLPKFSQIAAAMALEHRTELLAVIPQIRQDRDHLAHALQDLGVQPWPSQANFIYFRTPGIDPNMIYHQLQAQGTLIRCTGGGLRVTVGTPGENQRFLQRLAQLLS